MNTEGIFALFQSRGRNQQVDKGLMNPVIGSLYSANCTLPPSACSCSAANQAKHLAVSQIYSHDLVSYSTEPGPARSSPNAQKNKASALHLGHLPPCAEGSQTCNRESLHKRQMSNRLSTCTQLCKVANFGKAAGHNSLPGILQ